RDLPWRRVAEGDGCRDTEMLRREGLQVRWRACHVDLAGRWPGRRRSDWIRQPGAPPYDDCQQKPRAPMHASSRRDRPIPLMAHLGLGALLAAGSTAFAVRQASQAITARQISNPRPELTRWFLTTVSSHVSAGFELRWVFRTDCLFGEGRCLGGDLEP